MLVNIILVSMRWFIGLFLVGYILAIQDFSKFTEAILGTDLKCLAIAALFVLLIRLFYAFQTSMVVRHIGIPLNALRALVISTISQFYSLFIPGDIGGGIVKWYKISKPFGRRMEIFTAILFLKLLNTSLFLVFGLFGFLYENPFNSAVLFWMVLLFLVGLVIISILFLSDRTTLFLEKMSELRPLWIPAAVLNWLRNFAFACRVYRNMPLNRLFKVLLIPFLNHICRMILFFLIAQSLGIRIPVFVLIWIPSMVYVIQLIPITIAGLGFREGALAYLLPFYGINSVDAITFSIILFSFTVLFGLVGGILEGAEVLLIPLYRKLRY